MVPYHGWAAWHHWTGLIGGVALTTWIFSGWMSLDPGRFFHASGVSSEQLRRYAGHDEPDTGFDLTRLRAAIQPSTIVVHFAWVGGAPVASLSEKAGTASISPDPSRFLSQDDLRDAAQRLLPGATISLQRLTEEDAYWYAHHRQRVLPVLRAVFNDPEKTWFHIDPRTGEILGRIDAKGRDYRWLYNGLHSFDFGFLLRNRPAWDIVVGTLSMPGLIVSLSGTVIGWRRLRQRLSR
jgi:uncharacterized iron-regulated membrane protein